MSTAELSRLLVQALGGLTDGSVQVDIDSVPFAAVDARSRNLDLQIAPLLDQARRVRSVARDEGPAGLWTASHIPADLARKGWRLTLYDGPEELLALGRGTSTLTGHVRVHPAQLWKLRKLL
jgi:hypothetical protein